MDNQAWIQELLKEIGELESMIVKAAQSDEKEEMWGTSMLKRLLRRRRFSLWCFQQAGSNGLH